MPSTESVEERLEELKQGRDQAKTVWDGALRSISITRAKLLELENGRRAYLASGDNDSSRLAELERDIAATQTKLTEDVAFAPAAERKYYASANEFNRSPRT